MNSEDITKRMDRVRADLGGLIDDLKSHRPVTGGPTGEVCWNCAKSHKIYLPGSSLPVYKPCVIWRSAKKCAFELDVLREPL